LGQCRRVLSRAPCAIIPCRAHIPQDPTQPPLPLRTPPTSCSRAPPERASCQRAAGWCTTHSTLTLQPPGTPASALGSTCGRVRVRARGGAGRRGVGMGGGRGWARGRARWREVPYHCGHWPLPPLPCQQMSACQAGPHAQAMRRPSWCRIVSSCTAATPAPPAFLNPRISNPSPSACAPRTWPSCPHGPHSPT
jgi:hypothetical protein